MTSIAQFSQKLVLSASRGAGRLTPDLRPGEPDADSDRLHLGKPDAGVQCGEVVASASPRSDILTDLTAAQIATAIRIDCARAGWSLTDFERLCGRRRGFVAAIDKAVRPKPETIATAIEGLGRMNAGAARPTPGDVRDERSGLLLFETAQAEIEAARKASERKAAARVTRAAAVDLAERAHRQRGQRLLRAVPASAFIAKARAQMEAGR